MSNPENSHTQSNLENADNPTIASKSAAEEIRDILSEIAKEDRSIKLIVAADEGGLVVGAYPMKEEYLEIIEGIGAISSEVYKCVFEALEKKAPNIAGKVIGITVGLEKYKLEFYRHMNYTIIIFKSLEEE